MVVLEAVQIILSPERRQHLPTVKAPSTSFDPFTRLDVKQRPKRTTLKPCRCLVPPKLVWQSDRDINAERQNACASCNNSGDH